MQNHELHEEKGWIHIPAVPPVFINNGQYYLTILPKLIPGHGNFRNVAKVKIQVKVKDINQSLKYTLIYLNGIIIEAYIII